MIVAGASVQGTAHLAAGQCCQDAFKAVDLGGAAVLAVSDGASSRDRSALGAHLAVDAACHLLAADTPDAQDAPQTWTRWIAGRGRKVVAEYLRAVSGVLGTGPGSDTGAPTATRTPADARSDARRGTRARTTADAGTDARRGTRTRTTADAGTDPGTRTRTTADAASDPGTRTGTDAGSGGPGALAATLTAAVVAPPWVAFVSIGDGFGTLLTRDDRCHLVLPPPASPPAFLSSTGAALRIRTFVVWEPELSGVVLSTDGCAPLALDHPSVHRLPPDAGPLPAERFFLGVAATLRGNHGDAEPLRRRLSGPEAGRTGDDLTLLCALLEGGPPWD